MTEATKKQALKADTELKIFPKGDLISSPNFTGAAWLQRLMTDADKFDVVISNVVFDPGVRNSWHSHPGGQILIATSGKGYYQERGKPVQILNAGDVVAIPSNVVHWHGAAPDSEFIHIAINTKVSLGPAVWYEKVTDEEYSKILNP
ncbi:cupin domain-containing protein [Bacteroides thetaiotaomicron]|uniref:Cupin domain-containing protein n=2 Tax=Bacteroides thetaiotaomicron TaxID=818 RepID=A0A943HPM8_BACT4|nr:cupin domain-containing protein [Bacteroides thetaiotaomicron]MBS5410648.1 cupin domain-containing protein [Bacteroides thetaiotaomicron]